LRAAKAPAAADAQKVIDDLHRKIGQLQVERDFLAGQPAIFPSTERRAMIAPEAGLSVTRQCALLGIAQQLLLPAAAGGCGGTRASESLMRFLEFRRQYGQPRIGVGPTPAPRMNSSPGAAA
jgi:hypothetical protein